uniref:Cell 5A endo-1,4-betaglucanase n=1 Tax=Phytophthora ramorum TaxID=164328 RepID=Q0PN02_PHYRM|nr:cell 5A endo-1,4-betaglucanase [Phytophthora ramorum]ABG80551.1 cell 5A endo-1,4-betaglucanase [Phytophthora ramorum]
MEVRIVRPMPPKSSDIPSETGDDADRPSSYRNTEYTSGRASAYAAGDGSDSGRETMMSSRQTEMKLMAMDLSDGAVPERVQDYKGRIRTWRGLMLLCVILGGAAAIITTCALSASDAAAVRQARYENKTEERRKINDGLTDDDVIISDDGQVGNPKKYPDMGCELPDYQSKKGQIFAVSKNGTEVPVGIKGVNWFGMETGLAIPFGLWENMDNGTSVYEIAAFLARNNFNSVRLPVCIKNILKNTAPQKSLINMNTNRAINITSYMTTIQTIVEALGYRHITVMISLHTLDIKKSGGAWYSDELDVTEDQFLEAVDMLTKNLCTSKYWNILGLDLKNEPHECSWGGKAPDWQKGSTLIGNRMLEGCPNWMAFVEGIASSGTITLGSRTNTYFDWWGGGLTNAGENPVELTTEHKVVWAPHYYNTGVYPAWYLYESTGAVTASGAYESFVELGDDDLRYNVEKTMDKMFGYLAGSSDYAMVMGEFAGLYSKDVHPMKTTKRTTDYTIEVMVKAGYAGGYMWSLNPESAYQYNPATVYGTFTEGLLEDDWITPNKVFMEGMAAMEKIKNLKRFPCFPQKASSSGSS